MITPSNQTDCARPTAKNCALTSFTSRLAKLLVAGLASALFLIAFPARAVVIYQTGFEFSEGYSTNKDLVDQNGWIKFGSGGNGIVTDFIADKGQQAYVGFTPPIPNDSSLFVLQPLDLNASKVQFSVTLAIFDSTPPNTNRDDFYWTVFNQQLDQLFTVDFDNQELRVYYILDDNKNRTWSGVNFTNDGAYQLTIAMDFASNRWSATLNGILVTNNQPITTVGKPLNLGDIDAAWAIWDPKAPGDNFMVFDDYQVSATVPPPQLKILSITNGVPTLRVSGQPSNPFAVEASTNLTSWVALKTNITTGGSFTYVDNASVGFPVRFYRARWAP
jgi:hypothetical protein